MPYTWLDGTALYLGDPVARTVNGFQDPVVRVSMNFLGAPALTAEEFARYEQDLIVGASLQVSVPVGQYDATRLVNLGTNRWFVKPEIGVSKAIGRWTFEGKAAATLFTDQRRVLQRQPARAGSALLGRRARDLPLPARHVGRRSTPPTSAAAARR